MQEEEILDTILFTRYENKWEEVSQISDEFNRRLKKQYFIEAIEMISPTEGLLKFQNQQICHEAFRIFVSSQDRTQYEFVSSNYFVDLPLAKLMASGKFVCDKTSLDLSCVPVEHIVGLDN